MVAAMLSSVKTFDAGPLGHKKNMGTHLGMTCDFSLVPFLVRMTTPSEDCSVPMKHAP